MTLWKVRASKTRHVLRIAEVIGLAILVQVCALVQRLWLVQKLARARARIARWSEAHCVDTLTHTI